MDRGGAGGIRRCLRILRIVEAPTRWPSLSSSPWKRWYPRVSLVPGAVEVGCGSPEGALGVALLPDLGQSAVRVAGLGCPALGRFVEEDEGVEQPDQ